MGASETQLDCLICNRSEMEIPLVSARYDGQQLWVCSSCMPVLIHNPQQLIGKLSGADKIPPSPHSH